jgi:N-acyl-D-amino-acid deacylase
MKTLLKGGQIYDGTGSAPFLGDVLIDGNTISYVGESAPGDVDRTIDCTGLCVAPGFIDAHSHNDFFCNYDNAEVYFSPFLRQGITTQVTGNCGFSPFGIEPDSEHKANVGAGLFEAKHPGSFKDFVSKCEGKLYVNIVPLIGHGTTRISVNGLEPGSLNAAQREKMLSHVREAMENGAFGGSFGFMYEPGMYSDMDELVAFASTIAEYGGIVTVHPRACSKVAMGFPLLSKKPHIEMALDEVIEIMQRSKCRMEYSHLIFVGSSSWKSIDPMLKKFYDYRAAGYDIAYDNYSMTYGASVITVICPPWYMALTEEQKKSKLNRIKLRLVVDVTRKLLGIDYKDITVAYINDEPRYKAFEGRNVAEIAKSEGRDCLDLYLELIDASKGSGKVYLDKYYNEELICRLMNDELSVFMTDAWVEPRGVQNGAAFQGYPKFLITARNNSIPWEKVINKMTWKTAQRFGFEQRGKLEAGFFADVTIFDPNGLKVYPEDPGKSADGIRYVFVNGEAAVDNGSFTGAHNGSMVLKKRA